MSCCWRDMGSMQSFTIVNLKDKEKERQAEKTDTSYCVNHHTGNPVFSAVFLPFFCRLTEPEERIQEKKRQIQPEKENRSLHFESAGQRQIQKDRSGGRQQDQYGGEAGKSPEKEVPG